MTKAKQFLSLDKMFFAFLLAVSWLVLASNFCVAEESVGNLFKGRSVESTGGQDFSGILGGGGGGCANGQCGVRPPSGGGFSNPGGGGFSGGGGGNCANGQCGLPQGGGGSGGGCASGNCGGGGQQQGGCSSGNCGGEQQQGGCDGGGGCGGGNDGKFAGRKVSQGAGGVNQQGKNLLLPILAGGFAYLASQKNNNDSNDSSNNDADNNTDADSQDDENQSENADDTASGPELNTAPEQEADEQEEEDGQANESEDEEQPKASPSPGLRSHLSKEFFESNANCLAGVCLLEERDTKKSTKKSRYANNSNTAIQRSSFFLTNAQDFEVVRTQAGGNKGLVDKLAKEKEGAAKKAIEAIKKFDPQSKDKQAAVQRAIKQDLNKYDRGTSPGKDIAQTKADNAEILANYLTDCATPRPVGICYRPLSRPKIYWEYFIPYMKVETTTAPFSSKYMSEPLMSVELQKSAIAHDQIARSRLAANWKQDDAAFKGKGYSAPDKVSQEALAKLSALDPKYFRFRGGNVYGSGGTTEGHLYETKFTEEYNHLFDRGNDFLTWCHRGAEDVPRRDRGNREEIKPYFSEFAQQGLVPRDLSHASYENKTIKKYAAQPGQPRNCYKRNVKGSGHEHGQTPRDLKTPEKWQGEDSDENCDGVNFNDTIAGRTGNTQKNLYPVKRSELAHLWTWLFAKYYKQKEDGIGNKDIPFITRSEDEDEYNMIHHKRSKWMYLTNGDYDDKLPKGCKPFEPRQQDYYLSDLSGPDYVGHEAGLYSPEHAGNHYAHVVYSAVRCCPRGYFPLGGPREVFFPEKGKNS